MSKVKKKFVNAIPVSNQAKHRFITIMDSFHGCVIRREKENYYLLSSLNDQYWFWIQKNGNEHWRIEK